MFGYNTVNNYINITVNNCTTIVFDYYFRILQFKGMVSYSSSLNLIPGICLLIKQV